MAILRRGESYGYEILQRVRELSGGRLEWTEGMLYPVLHRLEQEGLIEAEWRESEAGRKRKYYCLTATGRKSQEIERQQWLIVHDTLINSWGKKLCLT